MQSLIRKAGRVLLVMAGGAGVGLVIFWVLNLFGAGLSAIVGALIVGIAIGIALELFSMKKK